MVYVLSASGSIKRREMYTTYVVHIHMYNEGGRVAPTGRCLIGAVGTEDGQYRLYNPSQTNAGSLEPAVLLRLNLRVYSMPLEESQKVLPLQG